MMRQKDTKAFTERISHFPVPSIFLSNRLHRFSRSFVFDLATLLVKAPGHLSEVVPISGESGYENAS